MEFYQNLLHLGVVDGYFGKTNVGDRGCGVNRFAQCIKTEPLHFLTHLVRVPGWKRDKEMGKAIYRIGRISEEEQLRFDFADGLSRTVYERILLGVIPMKLAVIDEAPYRIFGTTKEYRKWANENTPTWLGYHSEDD